MSGNTTKTIAFNYFGGKFTFLDELYALFPTEDDFVHLVDLFAGSMVVSLNYKRSRPLIKTANEINGQVTNFFKVLRDNEEELTQKLMLTPCSFLEYQKSWEITDDDIENARRFYVRVRQSFFGLGAQRKNKGWHMAKSHANCNGGETVSRWINGVDKLVYVALELRSSFQITPFSYEVCIDKTDTLGTFYYCDPPYSKRSRKSYNDYLHEFDDEDHEALAEKLNNIKGKAMVSGYDCSLMNHLYRNWNKSYLTKKKNNIRSGEVQEVVWMNYEPKPKLSLF